MLECIDTQEGISSSFRHSQWVIIYWECYIHSFRPLGVQLMSDLKALDDSCAKDETMGLLNESFTYLDGSVS